MYRIIAYDDPYSTVAHTVYNPLTGDYISDGKLELKESEINDLQLTVNQDNYLFGNVKPLKTHIEVYQDDKQIFRGRALDVTREMKDSGQFVQSFIFEDIQNYLQDTPQSWAKVQNTTPAEFFTRLITSHNNQTQPYKRFTIRRCDVTNSTDNVYRYIEDGATTWDTIKDKLVSRLGGFIKVERIDGVNYIDYVQDLGTDHSDSNPIQLSLNLNSASVKIDPTEVITRLQPLGAVIEDKNETPDQPNDISRPRVDIKSVNDGIDWLDIPTLVDEFGLIKKSVVWDDVHDPGILLTKARQWIAKQKTANEIWTVEALELPNFSAFNVSDRYVFDNKYVASKQLLRVTAKTIDFSNPNKSSLTIADKAVSLSQYESENRNAAEQVKNLRSQVEGYSTQITKLRDENTELQQSIKNQQTLIDKLEKGIDDADLAGVNNRISALQKNTTDLINRVNNLNYATPEQLQQYENTQNSYNNNFEARLSALENNQGGTS
ncbi:hypothetical protein FC65_GL001618 [Ligilactobacillus acidipiscis DSM 15836]|uniref:Tail spike domain-containing protein n=1 Tax=Ligilactobacillus acidipiscis DSM 15836 TaxID=1423716 RepID=A0ABR5PKA2_9LACO|nr:phage tail protein [Ligilactobacillus acidipiscis]KRM28716.1 hypothetical protein FC65_GL001618 [Ligilactobacillus acidipiscis DSM 15836]GAW63380.1 peptidase M23 [Ligilactobacillus acidipiscis]GEN19589.1 hypothetical protein LAC02_28700 [Ligilactobacillus acidipiscis]